MKSLAQLGEILATLSSQFADLERSLATSSKPLPFAQATQKQQIESIDLYCQLKGSEISEQTSQEFPRFFSLFVPNLWLQFL